jgi:hypothetical protein
VNPNTERIPDCLLFDRSLSPATFKSDSMW